MGASRDPLPPARGLYSESRRSHAPRHGELPGAGVARAIVRAMLVAVDVHYTERGTTTACVGFTAWSDAVTVGEHVVHADEPPADYEPGQFYKRELPHLVRVVE